MKKCLLWAGVACLWLLMIIPAASALDELNIQGSTTVYPIAKKAGAEFKKIHPDVELVLKGTGSGDGIRALITGTANIANASRFIKEKEIKMVLEKGALPVPFQIAYDCIVPVVHPFNPVSDISMENLKKIYTGEIQNWKQVGGVDGKITIISRDTSSGTYGVWKEMVLKGKEPAPGMTPVESNSSVVKAVSSDKQAIGYVGIGYIQPSVKALKVDHVTATLKTALSGKYPIVRPLYMFTRNWPDGIVKQFINFVLDPDNGQRLVKDAGFLPLYASSGSSGRGAGAALPVQSEVAPVIQPPAGMTLYAEYRDMTWTEKVRCLQRSLKALNYPVGPIDGIWGPKTLEAFRHFQKDSGHEPDGVLMYQWIQMMEMRRISGFS